jgi:hypothetical protein
VEVVAGVKVAEGEGAAVRVEVGAGVGGTGSGDGVQAANSARQRIARMQKLVMLMFRLWL